MVKHNSLACRIIVREDSGKRWWGKNENPPASSPIVDASLISSLISPVKFNSYTNKIINCTFAIEYNDLQRIGYSRKEIFGLLLFFVENILCDDTVNLDVWW